MYNLLYFDGPPNVYKPVGKFETLEDALDWLNGHTVGSYTVFKDASYAHNPKHHVRMDQWIMSDAVGNRIDLIIDSGKFTVGE